MAAMKKRGLGKGIDALITDNKALKIEHADDSERVLSIDINHVEPNRNQPRKKFDEIAIRELADSIAENGVLQPILVRQNDGFYEIIAGERRWRASRIAGLREVPVIVKDFDDRQTLEVALIENIQREDLNAIEEAATYKRLADEFGLSQEEIAVRVGKSRAAVANFMRLLGLDSRVQTFVIDGKISSGHARAVLAVSDADMQFNLAEKIIEEGLNVRQTEALVKQTLEQKPPEPEKTKPEVQQNLALKTMEDTLKRILGTRVCIKDIKNNRGKIEIEYYSEQDLDRILLAIKR